MPPKLLIPPWKKRQDCLVALKTDNPEVKARAEAGLVAGLRDEVLVNMGQLDAWWLSNRRARDAQQAKDDLEYCERWDRLIGETP